MNGLILLNDIIKKSGIKKYKIAEELGITAYALAKKLTGKTEFKLSEIIKLCHILNLTEKQRDKIFFTDMLANSLHTEKKGDKNGWLEW